MKTIWTLWIIIIVYTAGAYQGQYILEEDHVLIRITVFLLASLAIDLIYNK